MKSVVYNDADSMMAWAARRIGIAEFRPDARAIGLTRNGELAAVAVFDNFSVGSSFISIASDGSGRWLNRAFLIHVFAYPFIQCNQRRLSAIISEHNLQSIRFCESCGFRHEGTLRQDGPAGENTFVYGMLRAECRFLPAGKAVDKRL